MAGLTATVFFQGKNILKRRKSYFISARGTFYRQLDDITILLNLFNCLNCPFYVALWLYFIGCYISARIKLFSCSNSKSITAGGRRTWQ
jgi:hypothetical protein